MPENPTDPFDLDALRVESLDDVGVERVLLTVPVRRPKKSDFFRVHPGQDYTLDTLILVREDGLDREAYLIAPSLHAGLADDAQRVRLFTCVSKRGVVFLWPARLPEAESSGGGRAWHVSALEVAEGAKKHWVKLRPNKDLGAYEMDLARGDLGEPAWPDLPFKELLKLAFKDRFLDSPHHDVIRELHGEL
jgi:hypothetical protein